MVKTPGQTAYETWSEELSLEFYLPAWRHVTDAGKIGWEKVAAAVLRNHEVTELNPWDDKVTI